MEHDPRWEDAWVLLAVLYAARVDAPADLARVIAGADYINHATLTLGELDGALARLADKEWVRQDDLSFAQTTKAEQMFSSRRDLRTTAMADLEFVRQRIGTPAWTRATAIPAAPSSPRIPGLSAEVFDEPVQRYVRSMQRKR